MTGPRDFFDAIGILNTAKALDVDALRLLYRIECTGELFYEGLAERIGHAEAAALLRRNGREERGHAERVRKILGVKLGQPWEPAGDDLTLFDVPLPDALPVEMFALVVRGELDGDAGYQRWADQEIDPEVQRLLRLNGREETVHGERVTQVIALLEAAPRG